jgi:ACS family allantoate permease-like MFS transporter
LGFFEGPIFPACQVYVVMMYKKNEQPLRIAIYLASLATLFIGPLSYGIGRSTGAKTATWKLLYITVGGVMNSTTWCDGFRSTLPGSSP